MELLGYEGIYHAVQFLAEEVGQRGSTLQMLAQAVAVDRAAADSVEEV